MLTARALLAPTARAVHWWPVVGPPLAGVAVLLLAANPGHPLPAADLIRWIRVTAVLGATGAAFLLDDATLDTTAPTPVSVLRRRLVRLAVAAPVFTSWWLAVLAICAWRLPTVALPVTATTVEAATAVAVALALAAGRRRGGGTVAGPALLVLAGLAALLPAPVALAVAPGAPHWAGARLRCAVVLGIAVLGFLVASRDPARREPG